MRQDCSDIHLSESTRLKFLLNSASPTPIGVIASQEDLDCDVVCYATRKRRIVGPELADLLIRSAGHRLELVRSLI
jgi:hypothetical protein